MNQGKLLLASESPYRKKLMEQVGLDFITKKPKVDEEALKRTLQATNIEDLPLELAKHKAASLVSEYPDHIIIGSDQTALFKGKTLNKPKDKDQAFKQLQNLSGQSHELITAVAVYHKGEWYDKTVTAKMTMRDLSDEEINNYIERDMPVGCAGSYKIESLGPVLFETIETKDFYSIIGIPLLSLCQILRSLGITTI